MPRVIRWLLILFTMGLIHADPSRATDQIYILVAPNDNIGAGFGELSPGPHDLRVTFQGDAANGQIYGYLWDNSGLTMWTEETTPGGTSATVVSYGVVEDQMGALCGGGYFMSSDPMNPMMECFSVTVANTRFPCEPFGNVCLCDSTFGNCPGTVEGGIDVWLNASTETATLSVTVHHGMGGNLTITTMASDVRLLNMNDQPLGAVPISGSGMTTIEFKIGLNSDTGAEAQLRARFVNDVGPLDSEDVYDVRIDIRGPASPPFSTY